jgi:hypothetical protein
MPRFADGDPTIEYIEPAASEPEEEEVAPSLVVIGEASNTLDCKLTGTQSCLRIHLMAEALCSARSLEILRFRLSSLRKDL